jgi:hypothetical protein
LEHPERSFGTAWLNRLDVVAYSRHSESHVDKATRSGALKSVGKGRNRRWHITEVDAWIARGAPAHLLAVIMTVVLALASIEGLLF